MADNTIVSSFVSSRTVVRHEGCGLTKRKDADNKPSGKSRTIAKIDTIKMSLVFAFASDSLDELDTLVDVTLFRACANLRHTN